MREDLRAAVDDAIQKEQEGRVTAILEELLREAPSIASAQFVVDKMRKAGVRKPRVRMRLAILRSFTVEPVVPMLKAAAILNGLDLDFWVGGFNSYAQEMLDPDSDLYKFEPDVVLLALQTRDLVPELWDRPGELDTAIVERVVQGFHDWIGAFRSHSAGHVVVHNLELPAVPSAGILDAQSTRGQTQLIRRINGHLVELANEMSGVHVLDYDGLTARYGKHDWHDERKWLTVRMPISSDCLMPLAREYVKFLLPLAGRTAKVLVVDLDNTLWGGVVAEDGVEALQVGTEYPSAAYLDLQRAVLSVRSRGVLLAIASKNDESDALAALDGHPEMLLRSTDFASRRINWNDKAQSLREIAAELNLSVDALAFLDDSAVEREQIRLELPEVTVIDVPDDRMQWAPALRSCPQLERLSLSDEDRQRSRMYVEQGQRTDLQRRAGSLEDFLRSLEMVIDMREMSPEALPRVAQLTQKTNQFNLTTRRYSEQQLAELAGDPCARIYQVRVRDRFGDNGIVGVAITRASNGAWEIDTFLLSCRVIGRTVEKAMLAQIADDALAAGATRLRGWYLVTKKNQPASGFYADSGFSVVNGGDGATLWELQLQGDRPSRPDWIKCAS